ncbi:hypothetical protein [Desulfovibrio sp. JC022]|uniref:hypothetical protein n=1 Tax=Desulfovibrio sp. JC022 TaxID=2593642 RepID=UPI0013D26097|nr:hypothetical protein [Desulfovibrio sp. JC022]NDV22079.1 hypothetical protein [Desulfovibrio sp. JC022]
MPKRSNGFRKTRKFQRDRKRAEKTQNTSLLVFGEDQACMELYKAITKFYPTHHQYSVRPWYGTGRSPVEVVKDALLYKDNSFDKIIIIMDSDFVESGKRNLDQIIDEARKKVPNKRQLSKSPYNTEIKAFAIKPNCCECFLLKTTKVGTVSTKKCKNCKETCKLKKINSNDHSKYSPMIDSAHLEYMRKQPDYKWLKDFIAEIQKAPS